MHILGVGHYHPTNVIDNNFLESLDIGTTNDWILERTGIQTRPTVLSLDYIRTTRNVDPRASLDAASHTVTDMGILAAKMAIKRAKLQPQEIGLCIASASVPQMCIPSHACLIASGLGIEAPSFDLNSACTSLIAQLHFAKNLSFLKPILLVQSETYTMATNYHDRQTAVLWGDGASAMVIAKERTGRAKIVETSFQSRPSDFDKVSIPYTKHFIQMGSVVQRFAILQTESTFTALQKKTDITYFIGHQANLRMLETTAKRLGVQENKHRFNVDRFGNRGAAGAPSVLSDQWDSFVKGDCVSVVLVGAGLSWGGMVIEFV